MTEFNTFTNRSRVQFRRSCLHFLTPPNLECHQGCLRILIWRLPDNGCLTVADAVLAFPAFCILLVAQDVPTLIATNNTHYCRHAAPYYWVTAAYSGSWRIGSSARLVASFDGAAILFTFSRPARETLAKCHQPQARTDRMWCIGN